MEFTSSDASLEDLRHAKDKKNSNKVKLLDSYIHGNFSFFLTRHEKLDLLKIWSWSKVEVKYDHSFDPNFDACQMCVKNVMALPIHLILDK